MVENQDRSLWGQDQAWNQCLGQAIDFEVDTHYPLVVGSGLAQEAGKGKVGAEVDAKVEAGNAGGPVKDEAGADPGVEAEDMAIAEGAGDDQHTAGDQEGVQEDIGVLAVIRWDTCRSLVQDSPEADVVGDEVGTDQQLDRLGAHILLVVRNVDHHVVVGAHSHSEGRKEAVEDMGDETERVVAVEGLEDKAQGAELDEAAGVHGGGHFQTVSERAQ